MLKREEIARIKEMYPKGTPIRLYSMEGEQSVPPGSRGVVDHVDDIGQIHMKWENGSCLALNIEVDRFDIITQQDDISEKKEQEFIDKVNEILDKTDFLLLNMSCNTENTSYAAETLLAMHQAFEEVYGEGYVDEKYGMVMMPAVVKGVRHKSTCLGNAGLGIFRRTLGDYIPYTGRTIGAGECRAYRGAEACHQRILYSLRLLVHTPCGT